jgi:thymidylate synthase
MNSLDKQYTDLLQDILDNGVAKQDRTGTGTISVFGRQIRNKMSEGFPVITTKKIYFKGVVTELLWFLQGRTDLRYLLENDCHIWTGDAYKVYDRDFDRENPPFSSPYPNRLTKKEFEEKIMTDDEFNKWYGDLGPVYGKQWRSWEHYDGIGQHYSSETQKIEESSILRRKPIDQIANLINDLKTNPDSRRLLVSAWNPADLPHQVLPPCHYGFQVYTRELSYNEREQLALSYPHIKKLCDVNGPMTPKGWDDYNIPTRAISLMYNARSQDVPLGTPFNISSYGLLLTILAKEVNMIPDELIANMGDCHIYLNQIDGVKEQIGREPYPLPKLLCLDEYHYLMDKELVGEIPFTEKIEKFRPDFFTLENYQSHPSIKMPLSN